MISIIIPVYNGEKYIERNFESIKNQIYKDFEVIYVNDGSKDSTEEILENISKQKNNFNIKILSKNNGGVSSARNAGMDIAEGDYYCFIDVDDEILPEYLSYMYKLLVDNNANIVFCETNETKNFQQSKKEIINTCYNKEQALKKFLYRKITTGVCTILCHVKCYKDNNFRFAEGYKYSEDIHMIWRLFSVNDKIVGTNKKLYIYYPCEASAMSRFDEERLHGIELMTQLEDYFEKTNLNFAKLYKNFAVARMYWSITWQCAAKKDKNYFIDFCKKYNIKSYLKKLIYFKSFKVCISSLIGILSLNLYRCLALKFGKDKVH